MNRDLLERIKANTASLPSQPPPPPPKRRRNLWPLIFLLGLLALLLAGWTLVSSPLVPAVFAGGPSATPTFQVQEPFWAQALIAKPTYTPTAQPALIAPTETPLAVELPNTPVVEETPALMWAEIVPDTPTPEYAAPDPNLPPAAYTGNKYILVDISEQHMYVYENEALVYSFIASTGMNNATKVGNFAVQSKIPNAYGSTWDIWMPYWLGIYWAGGTENGIHALPILSNGGILWEGFLGRPISYGCVVLGTYDAQVLYDWAEYGTPVIIQW
ncbi:MAG: L,D-transpeptidase family protein [Chloroflexota bacterium]|jgi:lipoprotein-anchoring transpeptidase ErfK/SrfK